VRLSEAIRLGAMVTTPHLGALASEDKKATCALGAAIYAIGRLDDALGFIAAKDYDAIVSPPEWLINPEVSCPDCLQIYESEWALVSLIVHLNDTHLWTRERIADWVETVEAQQPAAGGSHGQVHAVEAAHEARSAADARPEPVEDPGVESLALVAAAGPSGVAR
jgi:hypothetical protein